MTKKPRQPARFGAEVWQERFVREWSLWDLWYCVVIELDRRMSFRSTNSISFGSG